MSFLKKLFGKNKETQKDNTVEENSIVSQEEQAIQTNQESVEESNIPENSISLEEGSNESNELLEEPSVEIEEAVEEIESLNANMHEATVVEEATTENSINKVEEILDDHVNEVVNEVSPAVSENDEIVEEVEDVETPEEEMTEEVLVEGDTETIEEAPVKEKKSGFIKRLFSGLSKTRDSILKGVDDVLSNFKHIDEDLYEELEEALIMADFGVDTTLHIMDDLRAKVKEEKITDPVALKPALKQIITGILTDQETTDVLNPDGPTVILVIGVNGVGKTTSIGKMSHLFKSQGKKVLVAAADTFRAAAIEQLNVWTERAGVDIIKHEEGSDAAAVVFDAIAAAKSRKSDVLICDTAGRLQNKTNLMKELEKISRIVAREYPDAKKEILIVIDATTGQNAMQQVKLFKEVADISGIILTKLDGTAKGGAIVGIYESLKVPVKYIGVGEKIDDLQPFDANVFAKALFEEEA